MARKDATATAEKSGTALAKTGGNGGGELTRYTPPSLSQLSGPKSEFDDVMGEMIGPRQTSAAIPFVRIDHKAEMFVLPSGELVQELSAYIVHYFQTRAYWKGAYKSGSATPPDCASNDMIRPHVDEPVAPECAECPMAKFGSAPVGDGQACKVGTYLFLVNPELFQPCACLIEPPTSIKSFLGTGRSSGYWQSAPHVKGPSGKAIGYPELVFTRLMLERGGDIHCVVKYEALGTVPSRDEAVALVKARNALIAAMESIRGTQVQEFAS